MTHRNLVCMGPKMEGLGREELASPRQHRDGPAGEPRLEHLEEPAGMKRHDPSLSAPLQVTARRGGVFAAVLDRLQFRLRELGARRYVDDEGYEYWDLKPDWKPGDVVTL